MRMGWNEITREENDGGICKNARHQEKLKDTSKSKGEGGEGVIANPRIQPKLEDI